MRRVITGLMLGLAALTPTTATASPVLATKTVVNVTYCEAFRDHGQWHVYVEVHDGGQRTVPTTRTIDTLPIRGTRDLIESAVKPRRTAVNGCMVRRVNGKRTAIVTTVGGAEWHIHQPRLWVKR